jgi:hypothetical protein
MGLGRAAAAEAAVQAGTAAVTGGVGNGITLAARGVAHVERFHTANGAATAGKSVFNAGEDVLGLILAAGTREGAEQAGGNVVRTMNAGRIIGIDRATGRATSIYSVVTSRRNVLITAFPGMPGGIY